MFQFVTTSTCTYQANGHHQCVRPHASKEQFVSAPVVIPPTTSSNGICGNSSNILVKGMIAAYNFNHSCKPATSPVKNPVVFSGSAIPNSFVVPINDAGLDIVNARPDMEIVIKPLTSFNLVVFVIASAGNQPQYTRIVKRMYTPRQGNSVIITRQHIQDILMSVRGRVKAITFNNANQENEQPANSQTIRSVYDFINEVRKLFLTTPAPPVQNAPMDYYMRTEPSCKPGFINIRNDCSFFEKKLTEVIGDETKHISCRRHPGNLDVCYDEKKWRDLLMNDYYS